MSSDWLPIVWRLGELKFDDMAEARATTGTLMGRHNEIAHSPEAAPPNPAPRVQNTNSGVVATLGRHSH